MYRFTVESVRTNASTAARRSQRPAFSELTFANIPAKNRSRYLSFYVLPLSFFCHRRSHLQWRRQDLLRGGAKLEIMSWGTHSGLQGRVQQTVR